MCTREDIHSIARGGTTGSDEFFYKMKTHLYRGKRFYRAFTGVLTLNVGQCRVPSYAVTFEMSSGNGRRTMNDLI